MPGIKEKITTVSVSELNLLKKKARAYERMAARVFELPLRAPIEEVVSDFKATGYYAADFLKDLESGLKKSSWKSSR